jgi:hypothetical protein
MRMKAALLVTVGLTAAAMILPSAPARADNGEIAAGILGGLAVGAIIGAGAAQPQAPAPVYVAPAPVYVAPPPPPPTCYWTQSEPVWDGVHGIWVRHQVQVCD